MVVRKKIEKNIKIWEMQEVKQKKNGNKINLF